MGGSTKANLYLLDPIVGWVEQEEQTFGTKKRVVNAALWMFHHADGDAKIAAIRAVAAMERGIDTSADAQAAIDDEATAAETAAKRRKKGKGAA